MTSIDINCDLGEGFPNDAQLIPLVSSVNIACGGHAGDETTLAAAIKLAKTSGVNIGAHPGYEDRANFGRVEIQLSPGEVGELVLRQVRRLLTVVQSEGAELKHVKPHGALYHVANRDEAIARAFVEAVAAIDLEMAIVCPPSGFLSATAKLAGLRVVRECFVDRAYRADGTLLPRDIAGAVIQDERVAVAQALEIICHHQVTTRDGTVIPMKADTLCVHGDGEHALRVLLYLRKSLGEAGVEVST